MMRFNGIGTTLLGVSKPDAEGVSTATKWFTFFYLPVVPIGRERVRFHEGKSSGYAYSLVGQEKLVWKEILVTYLQCWVIIPLIMIGPGILAVKEVWLLTGLPQSFHIPYLVLFVIWICAVILRLQSNFEKRRSRQS